MSVDLSIIAGVLVSLAAAAVSAAIPIIVPALLKRLHVATDSDLARRVEVATSAAAGIAYQYAASQSGGLSHVDIHNAALSRGVDYVNARLPDALAAIGLTQQAVREMVSARLGVLLAGDPSISAGVPSRQVAAAPITPLIPIITAGGIASVAGPQP